jgi:SET domain-containing protein
MSDFDLYLKEIGFTNQQLLDWMEYNDKYYLIEVESDVYYKAVSKIQGQGLFANKNILKGEVIGEATINDKRTTLTRYINHSSNPNVVFKMINDEVIGFALKKIKKNEELLVNYRHEEL